MQNELFKQFVNNGESTKRLRNYALQCICNELVESIRSSKESIFFLFPLNYLIHLHLLNPSLLSFSFTITSNRKTYPYLSTIWDKIFGTK